MSRFTFPKQIVKVLLAAMLFMIHQNSHAIESSIQLHKGDQSGAYGFTLGVSDNFFKQKELNWAVSYNRLEDISVTWNNDEIDFSLDTIDLMLSYRFSPKSYYKFVKSLTFEFQAGVGIALTENKFLWPELNEEKFFSEQGDVNGSVAFLIHKKLNKEMSMHLGLKHYPSYSSFGDISSIFLGFSYQFGKKTGY